MAKLGRQWRIAPVATALRTAISKKLSISPIVAQVLINRGVDDEVKAREFLYGGSERLHDPLLMKDMDRAMQRVLEAIDTRQRITVYGDYDVDGITACSLMVRVLRELNADIEYYVPERQSEGYGLHGAALESLIAAGTKLLITVDCGISAFKEVLALHDRLDIIITDHHQPPDVIPPAYAVINPRQSDCPYPNKQLAGVGVAYKLCQAIWRHYDRQDTDLHRYLDIVALGTIADMVSLIGENRVLVKLGLQQLQESGNPGLKALKDVCGIATQRINTGKVGFVLAPRLNAAGRVSHAAAAVELLITNDNHRAFKLASLLNQENIVRQEVERQITAAAEVRLASIDVGKEKVLVVDGNEWHPGVIGIVASRLVEKYYRPVVMITVRDGIGKGSCRSIPGFNMYEALKSASDLLLQFGGHHQAAGLSLDAANIGALHARMTQFAADHLTPEDYQPTIVIDSLVGLEEITAAFLEDMACLEPHGIGNPSPVFASRRVRPIDVRTMGHEGKHIRMKVAAQGAVNNVVGWDMGVLSDKIRCSDAVDVAFIPEFNEWQGTTTIQLKAHDIKKSARDGDDVSYIVSASRCCSHKTENNYNKDTNANSSFAGQRTTDLVPPRKIIDARHTADKVRYLCAVLANADPTCIYVYTARHADALATSLKGCGRERTGILHAGLSATQLKREVEQFQSGYLTTLVITHDCVHILNGCDIRHVVLFHLSPNLDSLLKQCQSAAPGGCLTMLFSEDDVTFNTQMIHNTCPDRDAIGCLYLTVKTAVGERSESSITNTELAALAQSRFGLIIGDVAITASIRILEELNLVKCTTHGGERYISLMPVPVDKLKLEQSLTYRQGLAAREAWVHFSRQALDAPVDVLLKWISGT